MKTGLSKGFGFVYMESTPGAVETMLNEGANHVIDGKQVMYTCIV